MTEEEMKFRLELFDELDDIAYDELVRLSKRYGHDSLNKLAIGIRCAIDYILDNYDITPKQKADEESRDKEQGISQDT